MKFSVATISTALLAAVGTEARIYGIAVPDVIKPGQGFNAIIMSSNYIQSIYDVAIAFGYAPGDGYPDSLGSVLSSYYLGPEQSNQLSNFTKWVPVPSTAPMGPTTISASLMSLLGAVAFPQLINYNISVTFGDHTSSNYVSSLD